MLRDRITLRNVQYDSAFRLCRDYPKDSASARNLPLKSPRPSHFIILPINADIFRISDILDQLLKRLSCILFGLDQNHTHLILVLSPVNITARD